MGSTLEEESGKRRIAVGKTSAHTVVRDWEERTWIQAEVLARTGP
jgi:hypothetical protein